MTAYDSELDDESSMDFEPTAGKNDHDSSDEVTEDAGEIDMVMLEEAHTENEQMCDDKIADLKNQIQQVEQGLHPEYLKKLRKLSQRYACDWLLCTVTYVYKLERLEKCHSEVQAVDKDFEEKIIKLKESIGAALVVDEDFEEKIIELHKNIAAELKEKIERLEQELDTVTQAVEKDFEE